jgi:cytidylate kinase
MENILQEYLQRAFREEDKPGTAMGGPVVTISREFGCPSKMLAQLLTEAINHWSGDGQSKTWRFINKEIVENAAKELDLNTNDINFMLNAGTRGVVSDVMASFANSYVSGPRMKKTITKVVTELEQKGRIVIVGRGAAGVLLGHPNSLHIRLTASLEWRIAEICRIRGIGKSEAEKLAKETDEKRKSLIELLSGQKFSPYLFDILLNCQRLSMQEMVDAIMGLMVSKKMIP